MQSSANDPFESAAAKDHPEWLVVPERLSTPAPAKSALVAKSSVAAVAYIPPNALEFPYSVFDDDGEERQLDAFEAAYSRNRFRFVHALQITTEMSSVGQLHAVHSPRLLIRANPTRLRGVNALQFKSRSQCALDPAWIAPPRRMGRTIFAGGCHARAVNGFFAKRVVRGALAVANIALRIFDRPVLVPQIGTSLQLWIADDGCKCAAITHNHFPRYDFYVDRKRLDFNNALNFRKFDAYDVDVEWRAFLALQLYTEIARRPAFGAYPGGVLAGWYRGWNANGHLEWCDHAPLAVYMRLVEDRLSEPYSWLSWWRHLESFVYRVLALRSDPERSAMLTAEDRVLNKLWGRIAAPAEFWCRVPR
jgi:hypothetical protein